MHELTITDCSVPTEDASAEAVVCHCLQVTRAEVVAAVEYGGCDTLADLMEQTGAGTGCTCCHRCIRELLARQEIRQASAVA